MAYENTQNASIKERGDLIVSTLAKVQVAHGKNPAGAQTGLVYPFDVRSFQNLYDKAQMGPGGECAEGPRVLECVRARS